MARFLLILFCTSMLLATESTLVGPPSLAADEPAQKSGEHPLLDLSPYAGKVVYLDFWASWCVPCKQSFPWMSELQKRLGEEGLAVVTVNVDRDRKAAVHFLSQMKTELPVIFDPEGKIAATYQLEAMPSSFIYGRDGALRSTHIGFHPDKVVEVEAELKALLAEEAPDAKAN